MKLQTTAARNNWRNKKLEIEITEGQNNLNRKQLKAQAIKIEKIEGKNN